MLLSKTSTLSKVYLTCCILCSNVVLATEKPKLSLVIDDLGYSMINAKDAFNLPGDHTYAIIPNSVFATKLSLIAQKQGKEVIMHLPMQSGAHNNLHERNTLNDGMDEKKIIEITQRFLNQMPYISGINNHMGSHLTQFDFYMQPVMDTIFKHNPNLYFLDSRTSAKSKAFEVARRSGLKASKRTIFLDHSDVPSDIHYQFTQWLRKARSGFNAIAIAHPTRSTLKIIQPLLDTNQDHYQFVPLSEYLPYKTKIDIERKKRRSLTMLNK